MRREMSKQLPASPLALLAHRWRRGGGTERTFNAVHLVHVVGYFMGLAPAKSNEIRHLSIVTDTGAFLGDERGTQVEKRPFVWQAYHPPASPLLLTFHFLLFTGEAGGETAARLASTPPTCLAPTYHYPLFTFHLLTQMIFCLFSKTGAFSRMRRGEKTDKSSVGGRPKMHSAR